MEKCCWLIEKVDLIDIAKFIYIFLLCETTLTCMWGQIIVVHYISVFIFFEILLLFKNQCIIQCTFFSCNRSSIKLKCNPKSKWVTSTILRTGEGGPKFRKNAHVLYGWPLTSHMWHNILFLLFTILCKTHNSVTLLIAILSTYYDYLFHHTDNFHNTVIVCIMWSKYVGNSTYCLYIRFTYMITVLQKVTVWWTILSQYVNNVVTIRWPYCWNI